MLSESVTCESWRQREGLEGVQHGAREPVPYAEFGSRGQSEAVWRGHARRLCGFQLRS